MSEKAGNVLFALGFAGFALLWWLDPTYSSDPQTQLLLKSVVLHAAGVLLFLPLQRRCRYHVFRLPSAKSMLVCLPALLVAVNNFPILGVLSGNIRVVRGDLILLYVLNCLLIGGFEEFAFRGTLFLLLLENRRRTKKQIFRATLLSSAVFGLFHLSNLLEGAGFGATALQVGYSFLIGGMCAIVLLKTGNLILPILLHAIYDLGGTLLSSGVAAGEMWDTPTVILTALLGCATLAWMLFVLWSVKPEDADRLF